MISNTKFKGKAFEDDPELYHVCRSEYAADEGTLMGKRSLLMDRLYQSWTERRNAIVGDRECIARDRLSLDATKNAVVEPLSGMALSVVFPLTVAAVSIMPSSNQGISPIWPDTLLSPGLLFNTDVENTFRFDAYTHVQIFMDVNWHLLSNRGTRVQSDSRPNILAEIPAGKEFRGVRSTLFATSLFLRRSCTGAEMSLAVNHRPVDPDKFDDEANNLPSIRTVVFNSKQDRSFSNSPMVYVLSALFPASETESSHVVQSTMLGTLKFQDESHKRQRIRFETTKCEPFDKGLEVWLSIIFGIFPEYSFVDGESFIPTIGHILTAIGKHPVTKNSELKHIVHHVMNMPFLRLTTSFLCIATWTRSAIFLHCYTRHLLVL